MSNAYLDILAQALSPRVCWSLCLLEYVGRVRAMKFGINHKLFSTQKALYTLRSSNETYDKNEWYR